MKHPMEPQWNHDGRAKSGRMNGRWKVLFGRWKGDGIVVMAEPTSACVSSRLVRSTRWLGRRSRLDRPYGRQAKACASMSAPACAACGDKENALSEQGLTHLFPRRRRLRKPRSLRISGGRKDQICDPSARQSHLAREDRPSASTTYRATSERSAAFLCKFHLSGRKQDKAAPGRCQGRMASGRTLSARRLHRHQHGAARRERRRPTTSAAPASSGLRRGKARSNGRDCHVVRLRPTRFGFNFMRSPTISATFCARWQRPSRSKTGR